MHKILYFEFNTIVLGICFHRDKCGLIMVARNVFNPTVDTILFNKLGQLTNNTFPGFISTWVGYIILLSQRVTYALLENYINQSKRYLFLGKFKFLNQFLSKLFAEMRSQTQIPKINSKKIPINKLATFTTLTNT